MSLQTENIHVTSNQEDGQDIHPQTAECEIAKETENTTPVENDNNSRLGRRGSNLSSDSHTVQEYLYSTISMESLDLDIPSSYKVETVDFPSSPEALKKVRGASMPVEARRLSDDEEDKSIYTAQLLSNGHDVRLIKDEVVASKVNDRRRVVALPVETMQDILNTEADSLSAIAGEDSDLDSIPDTSNEIEESIMSRLEELDASGCNEIEGEPIAELTAAEELEESRAWRTFSLAGIDQKIDLRVLEPYKRVVSHGGYLSQGSRNAIIVFSACFLPDRSRVDYDYVMNNLFMYVISTLDQLVTDDYVLVYLHGATQRSAMPKFSWLKQCYHMIDRKLRKNLKGLYLVHPTFWLKTLAVMTKPFISSKFSKKLFFVYSLSELLRRVPLERASIPDRVIKFDFDRFKDTTVLQD